MTLCSQNLKGEIERWMEKYNTELEDRETELQKLQAIRAVKYRELQNLAFLVCFKIQMYSN
jgi:Tfp pilus assembly protein PilP